MTTIFSDGFESGNFDAWSATENSPTIVTTPVHHDSYAMRAILDSEASVNCRANKNITSTQAVYMRCYIRMEELFTQSGIKGIGPRFFYSTGSSIAYAIADCSAGKWGIRNVVNSTSYYESGTSTINPDQWYCLEAYIQINSTTGQLKLWVDGTLKVDQTGINTGSNNVTGVSVNAYSQTAEGAQRTIYFDCAVVADAYIGPQVPSTYVLTVLSGTGGTTNPTAGTYSITAGTYQSISATPNSNYSFEHWVLDSVDIGSANPYSVLMDSDHTIQPVFTSSSEFVKSLASGAPFDVLGGAISLNVEPSLQVSDSSVGINPEASPTIAGLTISGTAPKLSSSQIMAHMQVGTGGGSGYTSTSPPAVYIVGGGATTQATATAEVNDTYGKVTSIRVTGIGSGYTSTPSVYIANPASGETASAMAIMSGPATNMYVRQIILTGETIRVATDIYLQR